MLIDGTAYSGAIGSRSTWEEHVFRYCTFDSLREEGAHIDSCFLGCTFRGCDWYWGLFNLAVFVDAKFEKCTFRGTSFAGCRFVDSEFRECEFLDDNMGGHCSFEDTHWYGCTQMGCKGIEGVF